MKELMGVLMFLRELVNAALRGNSGPPVLAAGLRHAPPHITITLGIKR